MLVAITHGGFVSTNRVIMARHNIAETCPGRPCGDACDHVEFAPDRNQVSFTDEEYDRLSYLLDVLRDTLTEGAAKLAGMGNTYRACPGISRTLERMRMDVETLASLRERIEAR